MNECPKLDTEQVDYILDELRQLCGAGGDVVIASVRPAPLNVSCVRSAVKLPAVVKARGRCVLQPVCVCACVCGMCVCVCVCVRVPPCTDTAMLAHVRQDITPPPSLSPTVTGWSCLDVRLDSL